MIASCRSQGSEVSPAWHGPKHWLCLCVLHNYRPMTVRNEPPAGSFGGNGVGEGQVDMADSAVLDGIPSRYFVASRS